MSTARYEDTIKLVNRDRIIGIHPALDPLTALFAPPAPDPAPAEAIYAVHRDAVGSAPLHGDLDVVPSGSSYLIIGGFRAWHFISVLGRVDPQRTIKVETRVWSKLDIERLRKRALAKWLNEIGWTRADQRPTQKVAQAITGGLVMVPSALTESLRGVD